jgi:DNA repair protein RecO (recombination protein O)
MATYKTEGIILHRRDFSEADKIITIFTEDYGKIYAVAKGIRRPVSKSSGHLELFTYCDLFIASGRNLDIICQVETKASFRPLRCNLLKTSIAYYIAELVLKITPEKQENKDVFNLLVETFDYLSKDGNPEVLIRWFELALIKNTGFHPEFNRCVHCKKEIKENQSNFFSAISGGILCPLCIEFDPFIIKISKNTLKNLKILQRSKIEDVNQLKIKKDTLGEIESLMSFYISFILERELKSKKFVQEVKEKVTF